MPDAGDSLIGRELDGYLIQSRIGAGATGVVYRASHPDLPRPVAIKVLNENLGHIRSLRRRFEREARALSKLTHENVVNITDFGVVEDVTFIAMELLEGDTLEDLLQEAPIQPERALHIAHEMLEGLAFAHDRQIVHRDLKPANVFLRASPGSGEEVKILDFGLAKFLSIDELSQDVTLTRKGRIVGTPAYMAPEQITGVSLDVRADVYAAGVVLYEMLADRRPFDYDRRSQLLRAHLFEPVPAMSKVRPGLRVDSALEALVLKALAKDPTERYPDARGMLEALTALPEDAAVVARARMPKARRRIGATSVVISAEERHAATTGLGDDSGIIPEVVGGDDDRGNVSETDVDPPREGRSEILDSRTPLGSLPPEPPSSDMIQLTRGESGRGWLTWLVVALVLAGVGGLVYWTNLQH